MSTRPESTVSIFLFVACERFKCPAFIKVGTEFMVFSEWQREREIIWMCICFLEYIINFSCNFFLDFSSSPHFPFIIYSILIYLWWVLLMLLLLYLPHAWSNSLSSSASHFDIRNPKFGRSRVLQYTASMNNWLGFSLSPQQLPSQSDHHQNHSQNTSSRLGFHSDEISGTDVSGECFDLTSNSTLPSLNLPATFGILEAFRNDQSQGLYSENWFFSFTWKKKVLKP